MLAKVAGRLMSNGLTSRPAARSTAASALRPSATPWPSAAAWSTRFESVKAGPRVGSLVLAQGLQRAPVQQLGVALAAHLVEDHAGERHLGPLAHEAVHQRGVRGDRALHVDDERPPNRPDQMARSLSSERSERDADSISARAILRRNRMESSAKCRINCRSDPWITG